MDAEAKLKIELKREQRLTDLEKQIEKTKKLRKELGSEFNELLVLFLTTALGVVAALFWQTAIIDTIKAFIPINGAWTYELFVALLVTLLSVLVVLIVSRFGNKLKKAKIQKIKLKKIIKLRK